MSRRSGALTAFAALAAGTVVVAALLLGGTAPSSPFHGRSGPDAPAGGSTGAGAGSGAGAGAGSGAGAGAGQAGGRAKPVVAAAVQHDTSRALRSVTPEPPEREDSDPDAAKPFVLPGRGASQPGRAIDPRLQDSPVANATAATVAVSFDGVSNINGVLPPDTNGDIGPNDYVQWVNLSFAIYSRTGTLLYGPAAGSTLWNGFGAPCETTNNGDPIVQYDHLADRWVMSQFALPNYPNGPFYMCIAVSQTGDPLGSWNRYAFKISDTKLDDYPHLTVWPDGYYLSINQFVGNSWGGQGAVAFERSKMLAGQAAQMVYFDMLGVDSSLGGMLPSDLDGQAPPNGAPNVFVEADDNANGYPHDQLQLYDFHVDWTTPGNSTFGPDPASPIQVASMDTNLCGYSRDCIPQPPFTVKHQQQTQGLDALSDRIMYRLQYRNFGAYQTLVTTNTVDTDGSDHAGIRWFEVRNSGSGWAIRQQGTWAPDAADRWLGSAAMNGNGDIGIGYSKSSSTIYPSIEFAGRLAGDPLSTLTTAETPIMAGSGTQTHTAARWGDYSMLAVDPSDDCTFWYTNEYLATTSSASWRTRIASIQLPDCAGGGDTTPPTVSSFAPTTTSPTNATTISYALTFSESVTGLAAGDFSRTGTATGCSVNAPSGSGASYTVTVSGCGNGTVILALNANTVADLASNVGPTSPSTASTVTIDRTAPTATVTAPSSPTKATSLSFGVSFSESVTGLAAGDFATGGTASGCSIGAPSGSGSSYTVVLSSCSEGTVTLTLHANTVADAAGNPGPAADATSGTVTVDRTAPTATVTAPASPTAPMPLSFGVSFSESVTGLAAGDFATGGTSTGCSIGAPSGSGSSYTVVVSSCSVGTVSLTLHANTVADLATNSGPTSDATSSTVTIQGSDTTPPSVSSFAPTTSSPTNASTVSYGLTFSESVTGLAAGDFSQVGTSAGCSVNAPSGSGASYVVSVSGCGSGSVILQLNANTVADLATNTGPTTSATAATVTVDRTAPTVTAPGATLRSNVQISGSTLLIAVGWSASDGTGVGVASYDVARSIDGGTFTTILAGTTAVALNAGASSGHTYRFEVRATDALGNVGGWLPGPTLHPTLYQQSYSGISYHGTWTTATSTNFSGGSAKYATAAGAYATYTFTGRGVAFVTTRASTRGSVKVYIDGALVTTLSCYATSSTVRWVGFAQTWASSGTHTLKLVVVGTSGHPRVDVDAIEVLR